MSAKDEKSEVFSYFQKAKVNFLIGVILFLQRAFKHILAFVLNQVFLRKMLGTRFGSAGTRFL